MAYSTAAQVQAIVDSDMQVAEITELIEETDAYMDRKLNTGGMSAVELRGISRTWTALRVMLKDPNSKKLGDFGHDRTTQLRILQQELKQMIRAVDGITFTVGYEVIS